MPTSPPPGLFFSLPWPMKHRMELDWVLSTTHHTKLIFAWPSFRNYTKEIHGDTSKDQHEHHQKYILAICGIKYGSAHVQRFELPLISSTGTPKTYLRSQTIQYQIRNRMRWDLRGRGLDFHLTQLHPYKEERSDRRGEGESESEGIDQPCARRRFET
jgi:hypothetical protein